MANEKWWIVDNLSLSDFIKGLKETGIDLTKDELSDEEKKKIAKCPMSELIRYSQESTNSNKRIKNVAKIRSNILSIIELKYQMDQDSREKLQRDSEQLNQLNAERAAEEKIKSEKIAALKDLLMDEKDKTELENNKEDLDEVQYRLEMIAMNKNNDQKLKDLLEKKKQKDLALKNNDKEKADQLDEELYQLKKDIKSICGQKDEIFYKYFGEKYDKNDVIKFKRLVSPFVDTKTKYEWQEVYWVMSPFRKHRKARRKLNYVIAWMNMAGSNSEKWIINIMCRCKWQEVNPKEIYNWIRARHLLRTDPIEFWKVYKEQKDKFINDLINELKWDKDSLSDSDKKTIDQIQKRLDWYEEDFNRRHTAPIK